MLQPRMVPLDEEEGCESESHVLRVFYSISPAADSSIGFQAPAALFAEYQDPVVLSTTQEEMMEDRLVVSSSQSC